MKRDLMDVFMEAIRFDAKYVYIEVYIEGYPASEVIVNPIKNAAKKLEYIMEAYDDDLKNIKAPFISIVGFGYCDDLGQLEYIDDYFEEKAKGLLQ